MNLRLLEEHISRSEEKLNPLPLETIVVEKNALKKAAAFVASRVKQSILLVADSQTYAAAGNQLTDLLQEEAVFVNIHLVKPNKNGDVLADERSLIDVFFKR